MSPFRAALIAVIASLLLSAVILDDQFKTANSKLQNLPTSARLFNGRVATVRTDAPGSVTFDVTATGAWEFRYYLNDGFTLAATGPRFEIK